MSIAQKIHESMIRSNTETQAKQNIAEILGKSAFDKMYIATSPKKQFQKLFIQALNDFPVDSDKYKALTRQWQDAPFLFTGESFRLDFAQDILKHFRHVFPNPSIKMFANTFYPKIRAELFKEKLISLHEALGDVQTLSISDDPYSYEINEHGILIRQVEQAGQSLTMSRSVLSEFIQFNQDYFFEKDNYFLLQTVSERIDFLWIAFVMVTNPAKLSKKHAYFDFLPYSVSQGISDFKSAIHYLRYFSKQTSSRYINDVYALLDNQLTELESKFANSELPLCNVMQYVRSKNTGILALLKIIVRYTPNEEQFVILQDKFLKKHEQTDKIFLEAWRKHKGITDGNSFPFFNINEVQPLNHYMKHATYRTTAYQEILGEQKRTDVGICPISGFQNIDFVDYERHSTSSNDVYAQSLQRMATSFVAKAMRYIPCQKNEHDQLWYKGLQPQLGSVALIPEIGEQLSKLTHPIPVDIQEIINGLKLTAPEIVQNINKQNLFCLLEVLNTNKIAFTNFGRDVFDTLEELAETGCDNSSNHRENLLPKIFHTLLNSDFSDKISMDFLDTDFLIKNHTEFVQYCNRIKNNDNCEQIEYLIGKVSDKMAIKEFTQSATHKQSKLKV